MPTVLRVRGYRFFFWSNEGAEPPHIHVERAEHYAKYWLGPVRLGRNYGFRRHQLAEIRRIIVENEAELLERWNAYFTTGQ
jgi:hypothetical protein